MRYGFEEINKRMRRAIITHKMIDDEKAILVGLSGGKDSLTLLYALKQFQRVSKYKYKLAAGHISLGFPDDDISRIKQFCEQLDVEFYYQPTAIGEIVFNIRKETNPCSLCAKMRRGALNELAKVNGFEKVALAHHQDDVVETMVLNMFFEGRIGSFNPKTYLDRTGITVIRPFIYVPEAQISYFARKSELPVCKSNCPQNCIGKRQEIKSILKEMDSISPKGKDKVTAALDRQFNSHWDGKI